MGPVTRCMCERMACFVHAMHVCASDEEHDYVSVAVCPVCFVHASCHVMDELCVLCFVQAPWLVMPMGGGTRGPTPFPA